MNKKDKYTIELVHVTSTEDFELRVQINDVLLLDTEEARNACRILLRSIASVTDGVDGADQLLLEAMQNDAVSSIAQGDLDEDGVRMKN